MAQDLVRSVQGNLEDPVVYSWDWRLHLLGLNTRLSKREVNIVCTTLGRA